MWALGVCVCVYLGVWSVVCATEEKEKGHAVLPGLAFGTSNDVLSLLSLLPQGTPMEVNLTTLSLRPLIFLVHPFITHEVLSLFFLLPSLPLSVILRILSHFYLPPLENDYPLKSLFLSLSLSHSLSLSLSLSGARTSHESHL